MKNDLRLRLAFFVVVVLQKQTEGFIPSIHTFVSKYAQCSLWSMTVFFFVTELKHINSNECRNTSVCSLT